MDGPIEPAVGGGYPVWPARRTLRAGTCGLPLPNPLTASGKGRPTQGRRAVRRRVRANTSASPHRNRRAGVFGARPVQRPVGAPRLRS